MSRQAIHRFSGWAVIYFAGILIAGLGGQDHLILLAIGNMVTGTAMGAYFFGGCQKKESE